MLEPLSDVVGFFFTDGENYTWMPHFTFHWIHHDLSFDNYHFILFMTTVSLVLFHHPTNAMISLIIYIILSLSDDCTICIIPFINAMIISSFASSWPCLPWWIYHCIIWDHRLHHSIIAMTLSSFALSYYHQRFHSLSFPHCKKHETEVSVDFIIVFTSFALQICSMLENTFLFPGAIRLFHYHKPSNSISFSIMLRCLGN